jgi:hypothetical protein
MTEGPADTNESRWPDAADGGGLWWGCVGIKGKRKKEKEKMIGGTHCFVQQPYILS